ncbi:MAG TPA: Holliday junction branch migration protein RuvA [Steroidobacteraceae bacterium]|nr:Holliday junction branch migration protein RuvA [Steroidobacteraceae bacterium]
MIGFLKGRIASKSAPQLTLDVGGVGYEVEAPMSTFLSLPAVGQEVRLATHLVVREDAHVLYGFATEEERRLFRSLLKVSGVGPKIALGLLSGMSVETFARSVRAQDVAALTRIPGVGRKTAERLVVELRDRLAAPLIAPGPAAAGPGAADGATAGGAQAEAFEALVGYFGYKPAEATRLLDAAGAGTHSTEELIRRALQGAAREQG